MSNYVDVTDTPLLKVQTLTSFIDTSIDGHDQGEGWRLTARFVFYPGPPAGPDEIINVWRRRSITVGQTGRGDRDDQVDPVTFSIPSDTDQSDCTLDHSFPGHSFGNTSNCANFVKCGTMSSSMMRYSQKSMKMTVCQSVSHSSEQEYGRNGWCPGAVSVGHKIDITNTVEVGGDNVLDFDILRAVAQYVDILR